MNVVALIGNLATDIELRDVAPDKKVASFLLAVDRPGKDAGADFFQVATWNRQAEVCDEYLSKGSQVAVDGRLPWPLAAKIASIRARTSCNVGKR